MTADLLPTITQMFEASLAVGLLIVLILCVRGPVARRFGPRAAYALWLLPLLRLALPPIPLPATMPFEQPTLAAEETVLASAIPVRERPAPAQASAVTSAVARDTHTNVISSDESVLTISRTSSRSADIAPLVKPIPAIAPSSPASVPEPAPFVTELPRLGATSPEPVARFTVTDEPRTASASLPDPAAAAPSSRFQLPPVDVAAIAGPLWTSLAIIWALVSALLAIRLVARQLLFADYVWRNTIEADPQTAAEARALAKELGVRQPITIRLCPEHQGPLVCGLFRPIVVVPEDFASRFGPKERRYALGHELLHVRRGDLFAIVAMTTVRATQWFNPFATRAVDSFRADQEAACDASVLRSLDGHRHDYAQTLLKAVRPSGQGPLPALTLDHGLKQRLRIMNVRKTLRGGAVVVTGLAILGLVSTASYAVQEPDAPSGDELDRVLEDRDAPELEPRSEPQSTGRSRETERRADVIRARVASVQNSLSSARGEERTVVAAEKVARREVQAVMREQEAQMRKEEALMRQEEAKQRQLEARERQREAVERAREAEERQRDNRERMAELRSDAAERARELRENIEELARDRQEDLQDQRAEAQEWAIELREELADLRIDLAEEASDIASQITHEIHVGNFGRDMIIHGDGHQTFVMTSGDAEVVINAEDGMVLLSNPMVGLEDRMAALENFEPMIPELPEPPAPPGIEVVEVKTADGRTIKLPESQTIILPGVEDGMADYAREVERIMESADIDGQVQAALGEDFGDKVRANTMMIRSLADKCEKHQETSEKAKVMTATKNGVAHKIVCFSGGKKTLKSDKLAKFVRSHDNLTEDEIKRFEESRNGNSFAFSFDWDN